MLEKKHVFMRNSNEQAEHEEMRTRRGHEFNIFQLKFSSFDLVWHYNHHRQQHHCSNDLHLHQGWSPEKYGGNEPRHREPQTQIFFAFCTFLFPIPSGAIKTHDLVVRLDDVTYLRRAYLSPAAGGFLYFCRHGH